MKSPIIPGILLTFSTVCFSWSQAIQSQSALVDPGQQNLAVQTRLPEAALSPLSAGTVKLLPGLFRDRRELTKAYVNRLTTRNLLQNHMLEAGVRIDDPSEKLHQGWEAPHYQLRGHFAGHWLSAAAHFAANDGDNLLKARTEDMVKQLAYFQQLNGGQWVGSVSEKYFDMLEKGQPVWSPQYTLHKTLMGLYDDYRYLANPEALAVLEKGADWFDTWTRDLVEKGRGEVVYGGECAGMLELWADLYGTTQDSQYLELASRYAMPDLFKVLLEGKDALSNDHANASVPWIQGAARIYEITGDNRYKTIVENFWKTAVQERGMFATTGNNAGEFWIPNQQFARFLGSRTQEHCTVYNMVRVAQYLLKWTGEARFADYIERALYNGILAQQNPNTGLIAYFLPLEPGAHKTWGSETHDFWCCHGSLVQAQAMIEDLIYYRTVDGITVSQFIPSETTFQVGGAQAVQITQTLDTSGGKKNFESADPTTQWMVRLQIRGEAGSEPWVLRIRQPWWVSKQAAITLDGQPVNASLNAGGFLEVPIAQSTAESVVEVVFSKQVLKETLPGDDRHFALMDGPIVLAALTDREPVVANIVENLTPQYEHQYIWGRDWQSEHYLMQTPEGSIFLKPLYEIADESYTVYLREGVNPTNNR